MLSCEVAATGEEIVITKRGRAVARVLAAEQLSLRGSVSFNVSDDELIVLLDVERTPAGCDRPLHPRMDLVGD